MDAKSESEPRADLHTQWFIVAISHAYRLHTPNETKDSNIEEVGRMIKRSADVGTNRNERSPASDFHRSR